MTEADDKIICPYCSKDVFEFGSDNYCYDRDLAKTRGETGNYIVHFTCYRDSMGLNYEPINPTKKTGNVPDEK